MDALTAYARSLLAGLLLACVAPVLPAAAQAWPERPIRLIINTTPGGAVDAVGRLVAQQLQERLGQTVVPENRAGGNGVVAGVAVQTSAPDGYTLLFGASIHVLAGAILRNPPYDPIADFTPVARVAQGPLLLVASPRLPQTSLAELIAAIRAQPRGFSFATSSLGAAGHLAILGFARAVGSEVPIVSYRGSAAALTDLTAGTVQVMADPILSALPLARGGQIRALAITAPQRSPAAPDIPTVAEAGLPGLEFASWYALWGPRGLPAPIVGRLNAVLQEALQQPAPSRRLADLGFEPVAESPADFARFQSADAERGAGLLRTSGFEPQ